MDMTFKLMFNTPFGWMYRFINIPFNTSSCLCIYPDGILKIFDPQISVEYQIEIPTFK